MRVGKQNKSINKWNKRFVPFQKEQKELGTFSFLFIFFFNSVIHLGYYRSDSRFRKQVLPLKCQVLLAQVLSRILSVENVLYQQNGFSSFRFVLLYVCASFVRFSFYRQITESKNNDILLWSNSDNGFYKSSEQY